MEISSENDDKPHEAGLLRLDITKSMSRLKWKPKWDLKKAIKETISWYKAWNDGKDIAKYSIRQIKEYMGGQ